MSTSVYAASWTTNLDRWSGASEVAKLNKTTYTHNYYMEVNYVGAQYDSVEHWIEKSLGGNLSQHSITQEGKNSSPSSTASIGDKVVLNVKNPISTKVEVEASGAWTPN